MSKTAKKSKVIRVDELAIPVNIASRDFAELCETFHIPSSQRRGAKSRLDELVTEVSNWMTTERQHPHRSSDRDRLEEVLEHVREAAAALERLGPSGRLASKAIASFVAPMLAAQWLSVSFPDDDYAPQRSPLPSEGWRQPLRSPMRASKYFIEELSSEARFQFVSHRVVKTAAAVLKTIEEGIVEARQALDRQRGSRGGRKPLMYRHFLILNLAEMWGDIGKQVSTGAKSDFAAFCETVAVSIGWPDEGIGAAVPKAIREWRNLPQSKRR
jgi:hypothetical protein